MFNLLPQEEQQIIAREYRLRLTAVGLLFSASLGVVALVALIPSFVSLYQKEEMVLRTDNALKEEIALSSKSDLSKILKLYGKKATALSAQTPAVYVHDLIGAIVKNKIYGIKIFGVNVKRSDDNSHSVTITGEAKDRETLLLFVRTLEGVKYFTDVTVPVSDFAPVANINFSVLAKAK